MNIVTVINAKGGCGKSTIAMNLAAGLALRGSSVLLIDMDPQAQVTQWLSAGDGLRPEGTLAAAMEGAEAFDSVVQATHLENLSFVASSEALEELGRRITDAEDYALVLARLLAGATRRFDFVVIDSPNQISPIMENAIYASDLFVVPFESAKAVRSYANFYKLLMRLRPEAAREGGRVLHVLTNLSRQPGLRRHVIGTMEAYGLPRARTEVRTCGWLAQVDEHGGSIFKYRPHSKGAQDMAALVAEALYALGLGEQPPPPASPPEGEADADGTAAEPDPAAAMADEVAEEIAAHGVEILAAATAPSEEPYQPNVTNHPHDQTA